MSPKNLFFASALVLAAAVAACNDASTPTGSTPGVGNGPQFAATGVADTGEYELCKHGTAATFSYTVNGGSAQSVTLADGECAVLVATEIVGPGSFDVVTTEVSDPAIVLDSIVITGVTIFNTTPVRGAPITGTATSSTTINGDRGRLVEYYNSVAPPPPDGCTATVGFWKTHLTVWPAPYTPGATFYTSGKTWIGVLKTAPLGNAYYILAHQFIAATLNGAAGASAPANVQQALADAAAYFADPAGSTLTRAQLIAMATLLDDYNNGLLGVPHCGSAGPI
jgi:hypothetical protein